MEPELTFRPSGWRTGLTCGVDGAFVSVMRPLLHQAQGLAHVVCSPHSRARVAAGLLQEAQGVMGAHHLPAHPSQAPGGRTRERLAKFPLLGLFRTLRKTDVLVSGVSVGVVHQFLCIVKTALQEFVAENCFCKIRIMVSIMTFFFFPNVR